jgi:VWFA-related protein
MRKAGSICLILIACLAALARAQQASAPVAPQAAPIPASEGRIKMDVLVPDMAGKPVFGLAQNDFTVLDNGQPVRIMSFHAQGATVRPGSPLAEVILLIDTVNIRATYVDQAREAIEKFLREDGGHLAQPVSVFLFTNEGVKVLLQPSMDGNALAAQLDHVSGNLRTIGDSAAAWGAVERFQTSVQALGIVAKSEIKRPDRKLLIWVGPGWPSLDSVNIQSTPRGQQQFFDWIVELSTRLREARTAVYSVSLGQPDATSYRYRDFLRGVKTPDRTSPANLGLRVVAIQSGGRVLGPDNDLAAQIESCVQDASAFYTLTFDPPKADKPNEYHELKVEIDKPDLTGWSITGYYNQPQ